MWFLKVLSFQFKMDLGVMLIKMLISRIPKLTIKMHLGHNVWDIPSFISNMTLSGVTTRVKSWPGSDDNEGLLHICQSFKTGASQSDCLVLYSGKSLGGLTAQLRCSRCTLQPRPTGLKTIFGEWVVHLDCHHFQVDSVPDWLDRIVSS